MTQQTGVLAAQRREIRRLLDDLDDREQRLNEVLARPLPAWSAEGSRQRIAAAQVQDQLHGSDTLAEVTRAEEKTRGDYRLAIQVRGEAEEGITQLDANRQALQDELQRVQGAISEKIQTHALAEFEKSRAKLHALALQVKEQSILATAWSRVSGVEFLPSDLTIPRLGITENIPTEFAAHGDVITCFSRTLINEAIDKAEEIRHNFENQL